MRSVLVVDDDRALCRALVRALGRAAAAVAAHDVPAAIRALEERPFDVVLCDADLGRGQPSGIDLLAEVARRWPATRRFLMSGAPHDTHEVSFRKPLGVDELAQVAGLARPPDG